MREIKARMWFPKLKLMAYSEHSDICPFGDGAYEISLFNVCVKSKHGVGLDESIKMLWIGLVDKNGKDIYDGDTVRQFPGFGCEWEPRTGVIEYRGASYWISFGVQAFVMDDHDCSFEVVGNIYQGGE
jgi:hypothetical protein